MLCACGALHSKAFDSICVFFLIVLKLSVNRGQVLLLDRMFFTDMR